MIGPNLLLTCRATFKTIGEWEPKIEISPGTFYTSSENETVSAYSNVYSPRDSQIFTCISWFDAPPDGTFRRETPSHQYDHRAPVFHVEWTLKLVARKH